MATLCSSARFIGFGIEKHAVGTLRGAMRPRHNAAGRHGRTWTHLIQSPRFSIWRFQPLSHHANMSAPVPTSMRTNPPRLEWYVECDPNHRTNEYRRACTLTTVD